MSEKKSISPEDIKDAGEQSKEETALFKERFGDILKKNLYNKTGRWLYVFGFNNSTSEAIVYRESSMDSGDKFEVTYEQLGELLKEFNLENPPKDTKISDEPEQEKSKKADNEIPGPAPQESTLPKGGEGDPTVPTETPGSEGGKPSHKKEEKSPGQDDEKAESFTGKMTETLKKEKTSPTAVQAAALHTLSKIKNLQELNAADKEEGDKIMIEKTRELWDKFATHGFAKPDGKGGFKIESKSDLDGYSFLEIMRQAGLKVDDVKFIAHDKYREDGAVTGDAGKKDGVSTPDGGKSLVIDHHGGKSSRDTSATKDAYEMLVEFGLIKEEDREVLDKFVEMVTKVDGEAYTNEEVKKLFDPKTKAFSRSIIGLSRFLPPNEIISLLKEESDYTKVLNKDFLKSRQGHDRNNLDSDKEISLFKFSQRIEKETDMARKSIESMTKAGFVFDSGDEKFGKILIDTGEPLAKGYKSKNLSGFLPVRGAGYGAYIIYIPEQNRFKVFTEKPLGGVKFEKDGKDQGFNVRGHFWNKPGKDGESIISLEEILSKLCGKEVVIEGKLKEALENENRFFLKSSKDKEPVKEPTKEPAKEEIEKEKSQEERKEESKKEDPKKKESSKESPKEEPRKETEKIPDDVFEFKEDERLRELQEVLSRARVSYVKKDREINGVFASLREKFGKYLASTPDNHPETNREREAYREAVSNLLNYKLDQLKGRGFPAERLVVEIEKVTRYYRQEEKINLYEARVSEREKAYDSKYGKVFGWIAKKGARFVSRVASWYNNLNSTKKKIFAVGATLSGAGLLMSGAPLVAGVGAVNAGVLVGTETFIKKRKEKAPLKFENKFKKIFDKYEFVQGEGFDSRVIKAASAISLGDRNNWRFIKDKKYSELKGNTSNGIVKKIKEFEKEMSKVLGAEGKFKRDKDETVQAWLARVIEKSMTKELDNMFRKG